MRYIPFLVVAGAAIYLVIWYLQSRGGRGGPARPTRTPPRPLAPDDDPEFLAKLDRLTKHPAPPRGPEPGPAPEAKAPEEPLGGDEPAARPGENGGAEDPALGTDGEAGR